MGAAILRISKMRSKWTIKLHAALASRSQPQSSSSTKPTISERISRWTHKYAMFFLPFITVLRESLEAIVFVGGVSLSSPATAFPLPTITGLLAGIGIGWIIYRGGNTVRLQWFLVASTCVLYLVAAGLVSKAAWNFETHEVSIALVIHSSLTWGGYHIHTYAMMCDQ